MIILKIGGSILTEKDLAEPKVDYDNLNRIAEEIRQSLYAEEISNDLIDGLVIVHGAGSFGHPPAKKYQIGQPFEMKDYLEKRIGFAEVQNEVKKLNSIICESLIEHGIPVIAIPPSSCTGLSNVWITSVFLFSTFSKFSAIVFPVTVN